MYRKFIKRMLDILFCLLILPFFILLYVVIGLCIVISDGFPIFYVADRIGKNGKLYKMYKFRSMKNNAPDWRMEDGSTFNAENDPRVTTIGRFLRKTSIDEIPQFLNVLKGDMSIIGPRPFVPCNDDNQVVNSPEVEREYQEKLLVQPGITGYTQAYFRNSISQDEKIHYDAHYAKNVTFWGDVKIFFKTVETVLCRKNIYQNAENDVKKD